MPSPVGHAMAGLMTAWVGEMARGSARAEAGDSRATSSERVRVEQTPRRTFWELVADSLTPLAVACAVLAVSPDFDNFFHTHRTWSHSLGAAAVVWAVVALVSWRLRVPVIGTATICGAAYASHVLLDWLGVDDGPNGGLMALWPLTRHFYKSGADLFLELTVHPRASVFQLFVRNIPALGRELAILLPLLIVVWTLRIRRPTVTFGTMRRPLHQLATTERGERD